MAARETGPGASSPGRASAGEEESDDEWPDVSDHEDEGDATTPIWSSSGSRPGGTSEARPSASAAAASAAASPASEDLPAHGFHIARSASAFRPAPDETARAPPAVWSPPAARIAAVDPPGPSWSSGARPPAAPWSVPRRSASACFLCGLSGYTVLLYYSTVLRVRGSYRR